MSGAGSRKAACPGSSREKIEQSESASKAAVREANEEVGLTVAEAKVLGERVHPNTGRTMIYVACEILDGETSAIDC